MVWNHKASKVIQHPNNCQAWRDIEILLHPNFERLSKFILVIIITNLK